MSNIALLRFAVRAQPSCLLRYHQCPAAARRLPALACGSGRSFSTTMRRKVASSEETFEEFSARFEKEFEGVNDVFELQRNLNNVFAYDLVPSPGVITAALRAARRVNDFPTAVRIFEAIKAKVENQNQYEEYLEDLAPLREELGVVLREDLYPDPSAMRPLEDIRWT
ncbi:MAG: hypothetical protein LQ351_005357 [Letrouitia transgressa]|nr:MAG: hypothetical protein LQ351_005357 [Letrouitia transgressa]